MIHRTARYRVRQGHVDEAVDAIEAFVDAVAEEEGTLRYEAFHAGDREFVHVMTFVDADAEEAHRSAPHTERFVGELYPLCDVEPVFEELSPVAGTGGPGKT